MNQDEISFLKTNFCTCFISIITHKARRTFRCKLNTLRRAICLNQTARRVAPGYVLTVFQTENMPCNQIKNKPYTSTVEKIRTVLNIL